MPAWHPHPDVWLLLTALVIGYEWAISRIGPRLVHPVERVVTTRQRLLFYSGVVLLWIGIDWPVHDLGEQSLFSAHMVEHMILAYVAPPLLLTGAPAWLWRWIISPVLGAARVATRPFVALLFFNAMLAIVHAPVVVELMLASAPAHLGIHALLLVAAVCMWSPVLNPLIELPRMSHPGRMFYLFLQSLVPTVPASFLTFSDSVLYRPYTGGLGIDAVTDQRIAGLLMKLGGGFLLWGMIAWYFFKWFQTESDEGVDVLEWGKLERDLNRAELMET